MNPSTVGEDLSSGETVLTLSSAFELYRHNVLIAENRSGKTEKGYIYTLHSLIKYFGDTLIQELTTSNVREWQIHLRKTCKTGSVRDYLSKLRMVLLHLQTEGYEVMRYDSIKLPKKEVADIDFLKPEEVNILIRIAGKRCRGYPAVNRRRNQAIIALLYDSGIRVGELCRLDRGAIYRNTFTAIGKGAKTRPAFTVDRTERLLIQYLDLRDDNHPALFLANQTGSRITTGGIQRMVREIGFKARDAHPEIHAFKKNIHPHILRHSFATDLYRNGADLRRVQAILGHSSLATTEIYTHIVDPDLMQVHNKYHTV